MTRWEPVIMAGLGSMAAMIDPTLPLVNLCFLMVKAFIGGAVGAYFGNHVSNRKKAAAGVKKV